MAALTVWLFEVDRVDEVLESAGEFKQLGLIDYFDVALVSWLAGSDRPELTRLPELAGDNRFNDAFWAQLFGVTFFPASLGAGLGVAGAAVNDEDLGLTPSMAATLRDEMRPGTAALFVYSSGASARDGAASDEIRRRRKGIPLRLLSSNLTSEQDEHLRDVYRGA